MPAPLVKLQFKPGLNLDDTELENEVGYSDGNFVRFRNGLVEFIGGREQVVSTAYRGLVRGSHSWAAQDGTRVLAFGTTLDLYGCLAPTVGGTNTLRSIAPVNQLYVRAAGGNCTADSTSITVNVTGMGSASAGTRLYIRILELDGTPDSAAVDGWGTVASFSSPNATITLDKAAAATVSGGHILVGFPKSVIGTSTADGTSSARASYWSMDNFGDQLVAVKGPPSSSASSDYPLYAWTPRASYPNILDNPAFTSSASWALGAGWEIGATSQKAYCNADFTNLSQNVAGEMMPNRLYTAVFTVSGSRTGGDGGTSAYAGVGYLKVNAGDPAAEVHVTPISSMSSSHLTAGNPAVYSGVSESSETRAKFTGTGTYAITFYSPQIPSDILIQAGTDDGATTSGTFGIDNFTLFMWSNAYPVTEAPLNMSAIFADPHGVLVGLGGLEVDADYNPLNLRTSALGKYRSWTPDTDSLATEISLTKGSRAVGGVATRNLSLVGTDAAMFGLNWIGAAGNAFSVDLLGTGCGLIGPNAICEQNGYVFWATKYGRYTFNGGVPQVIESNIERDVFDHLAEYQDDKIWVRMNPKFNEVWMGYADSRDASGANKEISRQAVFNFVTNISWRIIWDITGWTPPGIFEYPIGFSVESSTTGKVMWQEYGGDDNGDDITAFLTTGAFDIEDGGNIMRLDELWPDWKDLTCSLTYTVLTRMYPNAANMVAGNPLTLEPDTILPLRFQREARQAQIKFTTTTDTLGGRHGTLRLRARKTGASR